MAESLNTMVQTTEKIYTESDVKVYINEVQEFKTKFEKMKKEFQVNIYL